MGDKARVGGGGRLKTLGEARPACEQIRGVIVGESPPTAVVLKVAIRRTAGMLG
jgi:hypothetical protein